MPLGVGKKKKSAGKKIKKEHHPDFARGPPPNYYPDQNVLEAHWTGFFAWSLGVGKMACFASRNRSKWLDTL